MGLGIRSRNKELYKRTTSEPFFADYVVKTGGGKLFFRFFSFPQRNEQFNKGFFGNVFAFS